MFRQIVANYPGGADELFLHNTLVIANILESAWDARIAEDKLGTPKNRSRIAPFPRGVLDPFEIALPNEKDSVLLWEHLMYAYMIENTRIFEVFRKVIYEFIHGEKIGVPFPNAQHWIRNTEELFYRDTPPYYIFSTSSHIRPDMRATRRNAYWRMFGMDLNHPAEDGKPYSYIKAEAFNDGFVNTFEELLREVWVALINLGNTSGANPMDESKMEYLVTQLKDMLLTRRMYGNLSREEFWAVATMSWFHLTVEYDSPIVKSLRAEAESPDQRLFNIAQRVGVPAHGLSKSFFSIADDISKVLIAIELEGVKIVKLITAPKVSNMFNLPQEQFNRIISHWSIITGRDMKAGKVAVR